MIITPYDRGAMPEIEKSIRDSDLGVNPTNDGAVLRINLPQLTEERRKDYIKLARHKAEDARVSIRNIRRHAKEQLDRLVKDGDAGKDDGARAEKELEQVTKRHVDTIDASDRTRASPTCGRPMPATERVTRTASPIATSCAGSGASCRGRPTPTTLRVSCRGAAGELHATTTRTGPI